MNWKAVARSEIGTSHQKQGIGCQDYGDYRILDDVIVGAVADGAGSAKHSDVGSRLAVETVLKYLGEISEYLQKRKRCWQNISQEFSQTEADKLFTKTVNKVIAELSKQAAKEDYSVNDLACTLLVLVATPDWVAAMQIGDGFIVIRSQESEYSASGYYAIQFFSLPSPIKAFRFEDVPHSCRKCCINCCFSQIKVSLLMKQLLLPQQMH